MKSIIAWFVKLFSGAVIQKIIKCIPALVVEAEKAMADGKITAEERKNLVWSWIDAIATQFNIKISGIIRIGIGILIDSIAKRLPSKDIVIPDIVLKITKEW